MKWAAFFVRLVRTRAKHLELVKSLWDALSWKIAFSMRKGETFEAAVTTCMADTIFVQEHFANGQHFQSSYNDRTEPTPAGKGGRGSGNRGRSNGSRTPPPRGGRSRGAGRGTPPASGRANDTVCRNYNSGKCTLGEACRFRHACSVCGKDGHPASSCYFARDGGAQPARGRGAARGTSRGRGR